MKIEKHDKYTFLFGTIKEVCGVIGSVIEKDSKNSKKFAFPKFYFSTAGDYASSDMRLQDIASILGEWYGCESIVNSFDSDSTATFIADYCGGGAASAGSLWLDELYGNTVGDVIASVIMKALEMNEPVNKDTFIIAETESPLSVYSDEELAQLHTKYEKFKLQWMVDHGYTVESLVASLAAYLEDSGEPLYETYQMWEQDAGFGGEIWPCFDEWLENENK